MQNLLLYYIMSY